MAGYSVPGTPSDERTLDESVDRLTAKLQDLCEISFITSEEKEKALVPLERNNAAIRDSVERSDIPRHRRLRGKIDLIYRIRGQLNDWPN